MNIYLYIKRHKTTGLKYFGKTVRNPFTYKGSGVRWLRHCRKHGIEHIVTDTVWTFNNIEEAKRFAVDFSTTNNIVQSDEWANLIVEQLEGGDASHTNAYKQGMKRRPSRKGIPLSSETIAKMRKPRIDKSGYKDLRPPSHKGRIYINNGECEKRVFPDQINQYPGFVKGKLKYQCVCGATADIQNLKRHHSLCAGRALGKSEALPKER